jgi:thiol-disulfide isomerase/thioredoxin
LLDSTYTDIEGHFELKTNFPETTVALLALGLKKGEFYLKPGSTYFFEIPLDTISTRGSVFDELPLQYYLDANDEGLTQNIGNFNMEYNEFVLANSNRIYRNRDKKLISEFNTALSEEYLNSENAYFNDYVKYTIAQLEWISKVKSDDSIVAEYFVNQPLLIHNIQYAQVFNDFFKARFGSTKLYTYDELIETINANRGYIGIDRLLQRSPLLASDVEVRELVAILLLAKKYYSPDVKKPKVLAMLSELNRNSKFASIQKVAGNYSVKLSKLAHGTQAPPFTLLNQHGESVSLSQFEGKFVLLNFNNSDCKPCLYYLKNIEELRKEFNGKLEVITIVTKEGFKETKKYANARAYDWPVLNLNKEILLLEEYNIRAFPSYLLLNPDLSIALSTAPLPGEGLDLYIKRSMSQYAKLNEENSRE